MFNEINKMEDAWVFHQVPIPGAVTHVAWDAKAMNATHMGWIIVHEACDGPLKVVLNDLVFFRIQRNRDNMVHREGEILYGRHGQGKPIVVPAARGQNANLVPVRFCQGHRLSDVGLKQRGFQHFAGMKQIEQGGVINIVRFAQIVLHPFIGGDIFPGMVVQMQRKAVAAIDDDFVHIENDPRGGGVLHLLLSCVISYYRENMHEIEIFSVEPYSFGISGLDTQIMTRILPREGVVMAPMDPWFMFSPVVLPSISTEWVRQFNLVPSQLRWFYWLPFDSPFDVFEWFPRWDASVKKYHPLNATGYPIKLPLRNVPAWVVDTKGMFQERYLEELEHAYLPPYVVEQLGTQAPKSTRKR